MSLQAGLRTLHEAGPELRRAISGSLEEATDGELEPATRRNLPFFGSVIQSIRRKGSMKSLTVNNVQASGQKGNFPHLICKVCHFVAPEDQQLSMECQLCTFGIFSMHALGQQSLNQI